MDDLTNELDSLREKYLTTEDLERERQADRQWTQRAFLRTLQLENALQAFGEIADRQREKHHVSRDAVVTGRQSLLRALSHIARPASSSLQLKPELEPSES